jgi:hypothetical protein
MKKCIYYNSPVYTLNNEWLNSQRRWGVMMWCGRFLSLVNLATTRVLIYRTNFWSRQILPLSCEVETKSPREMTCKATHQHYKKWRPTLTKVPHYQLAGLGRRSSTLHRMYTFLLVKSTNVTSSCVMNFHICKPSAPGSTRTDWTPLDLTYCDRNCWYSDFCLHHRKKKKKIQARRHTRIFYAKLLNQI